MITCNQMGKFFMGNSVRIAAALLSVCRKRDSQSIDNGYRMSLHGRYTENNVGRLNARFHLPENADFTLWVCCSSHLSTSRPVANCVCRDSGKVRGHE